ncbi:hypothetical protein [Nocardiopsis nanhaiensis]
MPKDEGSSEVGAVNATIILVVATAITFFLVGTVIVAIFAMAALSYNQNRMQRKLRHWQDEVVRLNRAPQDGQDQRSRSFEPAD